MKPRNTLNTRNEPVPVMAGAVTALAAYNANERLPVDWTGKDESDLQSAREGLIRTKQAFAEHIRLLLQVRDKRLYRKDHETFQGFCQSELGYDASYVHKLCGAAEVNENLLGSKSGQLVSASPVLPTNESQARPLRRLDPEEQPAAWNAAVESAGGKVPTAKQVEQVVNSKLQTPCDDEESQWPAKNAMGVFGDSQAKRISFKAQGVIAEVLVLQVCPWDECANEEVKKTLRAAKSERWISVARYELRQGMKLVSWEPLKLDRSFDCRTYNSYAEALKGAARKLDVTIANHLTDKDGMDPLHWVPLRALREWAQELVPDPKIVPANKNPFDELPMAAPSGPQVLQFDHALGKATIRFTKGTAGWLWAWGYSYAVGGKHQKSADFNPGNTAAATRESAIRTAATELREETINYIVRRPSTPAKQKRLGKMIVDWCNSKIREAGAPSETAPAPEPAKDLELELQPSPSLREVFKEAGDKKVSTIAKESLEWCKPVESALSPRDCPTQARYHLECLQSELQRIVKEGMRAEKEKQKETEPCSFKFCSKNERSKPTGKKIKAKTSQKDRAGRATTKGTKALFLIARPPDGNRLDKHHKYWSGPNSWTNDPARGKKLSAAAANVRLKATRKFESCKKDYVIALEKAVARFKK